MGQISFSNFFKNKRVLVTGDTGFKGSWLSFWLHQMGADVVGYALPVVYKGSLFSLAHLDRRIHHVDGDIRDFTHFQKVCAGFKPSLIFHLAAQALVKDSFSDPKKTFDTNIGGSVNVLEVARRLPSLRALIYVTSDKCYENNEWVWGYRENDRLGGADPYSTSKAGAEMVFQGYLRSFFENRNNFGCASVRAGNVIGGGDWSANRIVPDCIKALRRQKPIVIRNPLSTRPWQHVLDPLYGYLLLSKKLFSQPKEYQGSWNFGPGDGESRSVKDLVDGILKQWGSGKMRIKKSRNNFHESTWLGLSCDKAHRYLGWQLRWPFERAVRETVLWYQNVEAKGNVEEITSAQISQYMETGA